jgi:hypothetical protein
MLTEETVSCKKSAKVQEDYWPVFQIQMPQHHVYYLQMRESTSKETLSAVQTYMEKALERMGQWWEEVQLTHTYMVFSPAFEKWLVSKGYYHVWLERWKIPLYQEYEESSNLYMLLQRIPGDQYPRNLIILGNAPGISEWLPKLTKYMKTVTICLEEEPRNFEKIRMQLLNEFGVLIDWKKDLKYYKGEAALVLDYWGREKLYTWAVGTGSIWIDMTSMEYRRRAIEDRNTGIQYISLKSIWREEMIQTLDTANKIKYNTEVILKGKVGP